MYHGPERRRHWMYVTRFREYHVRDNVCVGVRNLVTGEWAAHHPAIGRRVSTLPGRQGMAQAGDQLCLEPTASGSLLVTGSLMSMARPPREATGHYRI